MPGAVSAVLEQLPPHSHPMDVLRTGVSTLGCWVPEANDHSAKGARDLADRLLAAPQSLPDRISPRELIPPGQSLMTVPIVWTVQALSTR